MWYAGQGFETTILDNPRKADGGMGSFVCDLCGHSTAKLLILSKECQCGKNTRTIVCAGCLEEMAKKIYSAILK
jgi:hypothetical protein